MRLRHQIVALLAAIGVLLSGCSAKPAETLTVYSPGGLGDWYRAQFEKFTAETGIKVTLFEAGSGEVVSRINSPAVWQRLDSQPVPPADLLVTLPPFIQKAAKAGLLQSSGVDTAGISTGSLDPGGLFVPIVRTALCFIASPSANPKPVTWDDLLRPDLTGKIQYSEPGQAGDGTALLLLLQHLKGKQGALDYMAKLHANSVAPSTSTSVLQPKVANGEILVANGDVQMNLAAINSGSQFSIFFPAAPDNTRTTVSLPYVAGVTAGSARPEAARNLLAFLLSDAVQRSVFTEAHGRPAREAIAAEMTAGGGPTSPTGILNGVTLWVPDWDTVLAELDTDIADYTKAVGG
ncbi:MAG: 2-aminoethylphosphonate ABC transporter substrate-binding protein [Mycobacterium sp.]